MSVAIADIPLAILAGGLATRMRSVAVGIPKAMLDLAGRPFIDHQLELVHAKGIRQVVLCTGHLGEQIKAHVGDGSRFGLAVRYSPDGPVLLGTGGALWKARPLLGDLFFFTYGDTLLDVDYASLIETMEITQLPAVMSLYRNNGQLDSSNAEIDGVYAIYNKFHPSPTAAFIDYGMTLIRAELFDSFPPDKPFDLAVLLEQVSRARQLAAHQVHTRFYEIGTRESYEEARTFLADRVAARHHTAEDGS